MKNKAKPERSDVRTRAKHTPTPWHLQKHAFGGEYLMAENADTATALGTITTKRSADVAFIVRAVNAHDELLAVLKAMHRRYITESTENISEIDENLEMRSMAIIEKAEGVSND